MIEKCECESFNGNPDEYFKLDKTFDSIGNSRFKDGKRCGEGEYTEILRCKRCNSYYLWDSYSGTYFEGDKISMRKYIPKEGIDDKGLEKILKCFKGTVSEWDINEFSKYYLIIKDSMKELKIEDIKPNENKT